MYQWALQKYDSYEMAQCDLNHILPLSAAIKTYEKGRAAGSVIAEVADGSLIS